MHCKKLLSVAIAGVLLLAGCDRSVDTYNYRLSIYPSMGLMKNVKVRVYAEDGRTLLVKGKTGFTGMAGLSPGSVGGPVVVAIQAHNEPLFDPSRGENLIGSWYFDESLGSYVRLPAGTIMRAILPSAYGEYGVTPLTELAYRIAVDQNLFPLTAAEARAVNEAVRRALAPEITDIVGRPALALDQQTLDWLKNPLLPEDDVTSKAPFVDLDDYVDLKNYNVPADLPQPHRYALHLAALANLGSGQARPMLSVQNALAADVLDGIVDGLDNSGNALSVPYNAASMKTDMNQKLSEYSSNLSTDIDLNLTGLNTIDDGSNFTGCSSDDDPLLPSDIKGVSLLMSFEQGHASAPYRQAEKLRFSFCSDGQLRLDERYYILASAYVKEAADPLNPAMERFRWHQSGNGLVYELVTMDGVLYEVNLYGSGGANYLGRFVE